MFSPKSDGDVCPLHRVPMELTYRGVKTFADLPQVKFEGVPMLYCPKCLAEGKDSSRELDLKQTDAVLKGLRKIIDAAPQGTPKPSVTVNFNPNKAAMESSGLREQPSRNGVANAVGEGDAITARLENFTPQSPVYSLDRLVLESQTLLRIREALNLLERQRLIYETWNMQSIDRTGRKVALNFFGLPGTGKTLAADAIANHLGKKILMVSYAELESKYVGETPKNIRAAFVKAAQTESVLFFDEADSILGKRLVSVTQSADHSVNLTRSTTLMELDRFSGVVIFASNLVGNYDTAFIRRILAHIEFALPAADQRKEIFRLHIPPQLPLDETTNFETLAEISEGASGGDIKNAVLLAASYASMRAKPEQQVGEPDLARAIISILESKRKILAVQHS
ncbi:MAG: AAA family ATPase [Rhizobacter sp.]|nr:AAA family ATPase [Chlorobiales bacterium]